jgi:hypothetical protein
VLIFTNLWVWYNIHSFFWCSVQPVHRHLLCYHYVNGPISKRQEWLFILLLTSLGYILALLKLVLIPKQFENITKVDSNSQLGKDGVHLPHYTSWPTANTLGVNAFAQPVLWEHNMYGFPPPTVVVSSPHVPLASPWLFRMSTLESFGGILWHSAPAIICALADMDNCVCSYSLPSTELLWQIHVCGGPLVI